jgi:serine/threonine protein kinase
MSGVYEVKCPECGHAQKFQPEAEEHEHIQCEECENRFPVSAAHTMTMDNRAPSPSTGQPGNDAGAGSGKGSRDKAAVADAATLVEQRLQVTWTGLLDQVRSPSESIEPDIATMDIPPGIVLRRRSLTAAGEGRREDLDYELHQFLGKGGMGVVYEACQTAFDRTVAIKMIKRERRNDQQARTKFVYEAAVTGVLDHPNIVAIHDMGLDQQGRLFYAMKKVRGQSWKNVIGRRSRNENMEILLNVCDAVAFAHSRGVIHQDLKPANVMLGEFGEVLVLDWGLALSLDTGGKANSNSTSTTGGTPQYMAPEMARREGGAVGPWSDIYLLGAILYEIVTGKSPHGGASPWDCLVNAARNRIQESEHRGELVQIARKAMSDSPEQRYGSVKEFQQAIRQYREHSESLALAERADRRLQQARDTGDYEDYTRAVFGFEQALEMWSGNQMAREGVRKAMTEYANHAHGQGDVELASSLVDPYFPEEIRNKVEKSRETKKTWRKMKVLKYLAALMIGSVLVGIGLGTTDSSLYAGAGTGILAFGLVDLLMNVVVFRLSGWGSAHLLGVLAGSAAAVAGLVQGLRGLFEFSLSDSLILTAAAIAFFAPLVVVLARRGSKSEDAWET